MKLTVCCMIICLAYVLTCFASPAKAPKGKEKASEVKEHPAKASKGKAKASEVKAHPSKASKGKAKASEVKAHPSKASKGKRLGKCTTDAQCPPGFVCSEVRTGKSKKGRSGKKCYPAPNICDSSPCLNNGTCVDNGNGTFTCICESGYTGTNCSVLASGICDSSPCLNNGTCVDNGNGTFTCICDSCYIGRNCSEAVEPCPPGWELLFSGSCYFSSSEQKTWADARADCIARGGYLVEIESYEENEFLYSYVFREWIGLHDLAIEGVLVWSSNRSLGPFNYFEGADVSNSQNSIPYDCVYFLDYYWYFADCSRTLGYICEKELSCR